MKQKRRLTFTYVLGVLLVANLLVLVNALADKEETEHLQEEQEILDLAEESVQISKERISTLNDDISLILEMKNVQLLETLPYFQDDEQRLIKEFPEVKGVINQTIGYVQEELDRIVALELDQLNNIEGVAEEGVEGVGETPTVTYGDMFSNVTYYDFTYRDGTLEKTILIEIAPTTILLNIRWKEGRFDGISVTRV